LIGQGWDVEETEERSTLRDFVKDAQNIKIDYTIQRNITLKMELMCYIFMESCIIMVNSFD
jgi:hypothetical protein